MTGGDASGRVGRVWGVKFSGSGPISRNVTGQEQRRERRLRSKGEVIIFCAGLRELPATIHDVGASGLGLLANSELPTGSAVRIESHGYVAEGVVAHCRAEGDLYHIGVALGTAAS